MTYLHIIFIATIAYASSLHSADVDESALTREKCLGLYNQYTLFPLDLNNPQPIIINLAFNKCEPENINLDTEEDPFTLETFRSLIQQSKENNSSFILASYRCQSQDANLNKIKHADGQSLIEWQEEGGNNCPFSRLPIDHANYYELYHIEDKVYVQPLGDNQTLKAPYSILNLMALHNIVQRKKRPELINNGNPQDLYSIPIATLYTEAGALPQASRWYKKSTLWHIVEPLIMAGLEIRQKKDINDKMHYEDLYQNGQEITTAIQNHAELLDDQTTANLARTYSFFRFFCKRTEIKATQWALIAAQKGNASGMQMTGDHEIKNENIKQGLTWYQKGADLNDATCMIKIFSILPSCPNHEIEEHKLIQYACRLDNEHTQRYINKLIQHEPATYNHVPELIALYKSKRYNITAIPFIPLIIASFISFRS